MDSDELRTTAKLIQDLTGLVQALLTALPEIKPWQRQLRAQLADVDGRLQILRMSIAMERSDADIWEAAEQLMLGLRAANLHGAGGRTDAATRSAVKLALRMGEEIASLTTRHRAL